MPLHPVMLSVLEQLAERPPLPSCTPEEARALFAAPTEAMGPGPEMRETRELELPTRAGRIPARLYLPVEAPAGLAVHLHGGGWVIGGLPEFDSFARQLAADSGCAVLLPDYRLAPEHPFPAPLEDAEDALLWAAKEAAEGFGRPLPLVVCGDSAGGNLAAAALRRLGGRVRAALQVLIYPVTDCDMSRPSYVEHGEGLLLTAETMDWFFSHYCDAQTRASPDVSVLRGDLAGQPPAVVTLAEYDVLHDEGLAYARALEAAGVPVTLRRLEGLMHSFMRFHNLCPPVSAEIAAIGRDIAAACADAPARTA
jgi:acetyl esterase